LKDCDDDVVKDFGSQVVDWQQVHGRNDLPWQSSRDPYRVWLSEIMLQQTQVTTVQAYFVRFLERFPDVAALAAASLDDVLGLWSGLGYYSRARNLHLCALAVMNLHQGSFPKTAQLLQSLPGIGRSTAAAIASLCFGERVAILDGNVKRVLTRVVGFDADLSIGANERLLWELASDLLPVRNLQHSMPRYTQGVMDLGATVCTARKPACTVCPLAKSCKAHSMGQPERFPVKTRKLKRRSESIWMLWGQAAGFSAWLSKRPSPGVWAGLYCFPLFASRDALVAAVPEIYHPNLQDCSPVSHVLTHKDLHLHPVRVQLATSGTDGMEGKWVAANDWPQLGLPAPVRRLLAQA
jgi:A/G-specific adenine glycosylase